jgi:hypothetical protein
VENPEIERQLDRLERAIEVNKSELESLKKQDAWQHYILMFLVISILGIDVTKILHFRNDTPTKYPVPPSVVDPQGAIE